MEIKIFLSIKEYNTLGVDVKSLYSFFAYNTDDLISFLKTDIAQNNDFFILGSGSNVLFTEDYNGIIIFMRNKGIEIINKDDSYVYIKAQAGEIWDDFVEYCVTNNFGGVENLSLIPGTVGASPVQNIGAYGVEVKDVIQEVEVLNRTNLQKETFNNAKCNFKYRSSIFKKYFKDKYIILNVTYKLQKQTTLNLEYGAIKNHLSENKNPTIKDVRKAIIEIRQSKLPDYKTLPNVGSFFKNPIISQSKFEKLKTKFPNLISYPLKDGKCKLAAGQLIDFANWKGKRKNGVGVHDKQALVIVNYNNASGKDILNFSKIIQQSVFMKFGVEIEREVTLI